MKDPWSSPWRDLRRRFSRKGRATLELKRRLIRLAEVERERALDADLAARLGADRAELDSKFDRWDAEEAFRVREALLDDLRPLYPGVPRSELLDVARSFRTHARDLPFRGGDGP